MKEKQTYMKRDDKITIPISGVGGIQIVSEPEKQLDIMESMIDLARVKGYKITIKGKK